MLAKQYIGDSVYVEMDEYGDFILTTENGYPDDPRNRIVMDANVLRNLGEFIEAGHRERQRLLDKQASKDDGE